MAIDTADTPIDSHTRAHTHIPYPYSTIESCLLPTLDNEELPEGHGENAAEEHHDDDVLEVVPQACHVLDVKGKVGLDKLKGRCVCVCLCVSVSVCVCLCLCM